MNAKPRLLHYFTIDFMNITFKIYKKRYEKVRQGWNDSQWNKIAMYGQTDGPEGRTAGRNLWFDNQYLPKKRCFVKDRYISRLLVLNAC